MGGETWPKCGHPKTPENTRRVGKAGVRCRECRRKIDARRSKEESPNAETDQP